MKQTLLPHRLLFLVDPPHACNYLPDRSAMTLFVDPRYPKDKQLQTLLSENGFRRSGQHLYRPHCRECQACIPIRIPVTDFQPRRRQRRAWQRNHDLTVSPRPAVFCDEHFQLYQRYINTRHAKGGMENPTPDQYLDFLITPWAETLFIEFRFSHRLLAICVVDCLDNGLSAVYTFFDPDYPQRSLGVYAILWSIYEAERRRLDWLYLGYWIETSPKMCYKSEYRSQEHLQEGKWARKR
uniref:Aspartate/glutamate leucyltransferase n=1 Tax=Candidatus Kentrum sp. TUN TaxID=2126343 RepID=A0A450ZJH9_9GAMM|nr:MAG: arginine-tRNA-protein transferase [Candidatus Kentron sp. TUN]VFK55017.1 MAG: arginine-tRNA-protein transferase [Candidatus Kentron sp. TUN]VFK55795.1 MAG: arginine-tRNA-protein transferase [Candidatus Kentron sp. TUN]